MPSKLSGFVVSALVVGLVGWVGCGEDAPTAKKTASYEDGRIFLSNRTDIDLEVTYTHEDLGRIKTPVGAQETKEVSQAILEGGSSVTLEVLIFNPVENVNKTERVDVEVDGNITVVIRTILIAADGEIGEVDYSLVSGGG